METFILPKLSCPIDSGINPAVERAQAHNQAWVCTFGLVKDDAAYERFCRARFGWLIGRCYPKADPEMLELLLDFNSLLFLLDDENDEGKVRNQSKHMRRTHAQLVAVLQEQGITPDDPFVTSLADVWHRLSVKATSSWQARFIKDVGNYLGACQWEASNREHQRIPTVQDYISQRAFTGAMQTAFDLGEISERVSLPDTVRAHPDVWALAQACIHIVCTANDVHSFPKEQQAGDVHNLVIVLAHERALSWQDALEQTALLHNAEMQKYLDLKRYLSRKEWFDGNLKRYIDVMDGWIFGNWAWSQESGRYHQHPAIGTPAFSPALAGNS